MAGTGMGLPNADTFATYGGPVANYPIGVSDPTTEEDAAWRNIYVANVAGMTHTIDRAVRSFLVPTAGQVGIVDATGFAGGGDAVWGNDSTVKAVGTFVTAGTVDLIWPTTITDALGQVQQLNFQRARAAVTANTVGANFYHATAKVVAGNRVRVYTYDSAGNNGDLSGSGNGVSVTVWVR